MENVPDFENPIIVKLYEIDYFIDPAILQEILDLGEKAIPDLEKILIDSLERFEEYKDKGIYFFMMHALHLLKELKAGRSLDIVLSLSEQSEELLEWWFGDMLIEEYPQFVANLSLHQPEKLMARLQSSLPRFRKNLLDAALLLVGTLNEKHRGKILGFYQDFLDRVLANKDDLGKIFTEREDLYYDYNPKQYLSFLALALMDAQFYELIPQLKELFEQELLHNHIIAEEDFEAGGHSLFMLMDIFATYEDYKTYPFAEYSPFNPDYEKFKLQREKEILVLKKEEEKLLKDVSKIEKELDTYKKMQVKSIGTSTPRIVEKIGRNDPCPCGSGKKYKKCCMP